MTDPNTTFSSDQRLDHVRMLEALLFAAEEPLDEATLVKRLPDGVDIQALLEAVQKAYELRGVNLVQVGGKWMFRTAEDLSFLMQEERVEEKRLSRAALETLAIIAYHQPATRAEIEEIRGVSISKGTLDILLEAEWVRMRGRRKSPGRPVTYGTSDEFMRHFGLESLSDLPGVDELKAAGLLSNRVPASFSVPIPGDQEQLQEDEDPLEEDDLAFDEPLNDEDDQALEA
jgi:segregation and condensation protein B